MTLDHIALVFSLSLIFVSCQQPQNEWKGTIEVVDGVVTVKNPEEPIYRGDVLNLEEDLSIGAFKGKDEYTFSQINDLDVDDNGNIYGIDNSSAHIRVFDSPCSTVINMRQLPSLIISIG